MGIPPQPTRSPAPPLSKPKLTNPIAHLPQWHRLLHFLRGSVDARESYFWTRSLEPLRRETDQR